MKTIGCPSPMAFITNEHLTLKFLWSDPETRRYYPDLANKACRYYRGKPNAVFEYDGHLDVVHQGADMRLYVGALIKSGMDDQYAHVSYYLAVAKGRNEPNNRILRKFHFDFAPLTADRRVPHPKSHIQYAGGLPPALLERQFSDTHIKHMDPWFSEPRIPSAPTCLALLLHLVFHEFCDETACRFAARAEWRNVVERNERFILKNFHESCLKVLSGQRNDRKLLFDIFYGE